MRPPIPTAASQSSASARSRGAALALALAVALGTLAPSPGLAKKKEPDRRGVGDRTTVTKVRTLLEARCEITVDGRTAARAESAVAVSLDRIAAYERAGGDVARINASPPQTRVAVEPELADALGRGLAAAAETEGAYDPTIEPLVRAWDLRGAGRVPTPAELTDVRTRVGWRRVVIEPGANAVWLQREGMGLELGGVLRGAALDAVERVLREAGVGRAIVRLGDVTLALSDQGGWSVPVPHPLEPSRPVMNLAVRTCAVASAAPSGKTLAAGGRRFGTRLDPVSGTPIESEASVTVVTSSAARAQTIAAALLVLGRERAQAFIESHPDLGVLWIEPDGPALRAWRWRLPTATALGGADVRWMN